MGGRSLSEPLMFKGEAGAKELTSRSVSLEWGLALCRDSVGTH